MVSQPSVTLTAQDADLRSRRVSYLLSVQNRSNETLRIEDLVPKVREGLTVVSTEQLSPQRNEIEQHAEVLRADLVRLAVDHLSRRLHTHPAGRVSRLLHWLDGRTGPPYLAENRSGSARGLAPQLTPVILDHADAKRIADHYFPEPGPTSRPTSRPTPEPTSEPGPTSEPQPVAVITGTAPPAPADPPAPVDPGDPTGAVRETFLLKLEQLRDAERRREALQAHWPIAQIPAQSEHSVLFVLQFKRGALNARSYSVSIDVHYKYVRDGATTFTQSAETLQGISPYPLVMTLIAMLGGLLGVALRAAEAVAGDPGWNALARNVTAAPGPVVAPVLALIFFNIFEFTAFSERLKMTLNWRIALLIGVLCGLATDRILHALAGFLGP